MFSFVPQDRQVGKTRVELSKYSGPGPEKATQRPPLNQGAVCALTGNNRNKDISKNEKADLKVRYQQRSFFSQLLLESALVEGVRCASALACENLGSSGGKANYHPRKAARLYKIHTHLYPLARWAAMKSGTFGNIKVVMTHPGRMQLDMYQYMITHILLIS